MDENAENYKNKLDRFNFKHMIAIPDIDENGDMQFTTQEVTNKDRDEELHNWADHNNVTESELDNAVWVEIIATT